MLTDGAAHAVDSSDLAFKLASVYAFREAAAKAGPVVMEPVMSVEVTVPSEFQVCFLGRSLLLSASTYSLSLPNGRRGGPCAHEGSSFLLSSFWAYRETRRWGPEQAAWRDPGQWGEARRHGAGRTR